MQSLESCTCHTKALPPCHTDYSCHTDSPPCHTEPLGEVSKMYNGV
ncbi:hypothetical protein [Helicobacter bilis]|nr:hypothetical protein [Helicobacter bilis]